ncbi:UPF0149 family protein [Marinomonas mediterranea]|uniref:YecA family protein n=1 Tax=Marinomonas mediterranea (strain ATCC 700492 / JCM 21426 / NBRC 103028 / MMB-1) TaxID=717774 RepID=F2K4L3_MARM1|nr:YecA family protein [Marinomonas mediterranea]ADZ91406.1 yecA family protein [Marinomonas mediterranea MMB-1]WCN13454.1 UPF0149 family protein [Marinomonas mediterranea]WCN17520.1 UPF0149 family protein [Marinomonas mediterranea MMB-1]
MAHQPLDDLELDELETFLESPSVHEECQTFVMAHGFLTALAICPFSLPTEKWLPIVFEEEPNFKGAKEKERIEKLVIRLFGDIQKELESEEDFLVPCELEVSQDEEEFSELQDWACGFMEGVFLTERHWFESEKEEDVAELLIPFMVASGLFDDEEVTKIRSNPQLTQSCIDKIPDVVTDLFLALRTEVEKKRTPFPANKKGNKKSGPGKHGGKHNQGNKNTRS